MSSKDAEYMREALALARKGIGRTFPNPMVGCVIVKNNRVVGRGWHKRAGTPHAEIHALRQAGRKASGAALYVNLEPCFHTGRTPPCVDALIQARVRRVVIGMADPNPLTAGRSARKLRRAGVKVTIGVLKDEAQRLNEAFTCAVTRGRPWITVKSAQTLDGKIATGSGHSKWITSEGTRRFAKRMRFEFDAIAVGVNTVLKDDPELNPIPAKLIKKVVFDSTLKTPVRAKLFRKAKPQYCFLVTTKLSSRSKRRQFERKGIHVLVDPSGRKRVDLTWAVRELARCGVTSLLIEGGGHLIGRAFEQGLVDKACVYIAPKILGDETGLSAVVGRQAAKINECIALDHVTVQQVNKDILVTGYVYGDH